MGLAGIVLSIWKRQPISVAWSTPGVALLAVTPMLDSGFSGAVAGFITAGALTIISGLWKPFGRLAGSVPAPIAQAMLAGVLISLCAQPFLAIAEVPATALPIILTWFIVGRIHRLAAVPAAVIAAVIVTALANDFQIDWPASPFTAPVWIAPSFTLAAVLNVGLPLFIVTLATQNIPGIAVLNSFGYRPLPGPLFAGVGAASILSAPFGAPATCLAAITAAMCANEDSHSDPARRFWTAVATGLFYILFGLFAAIITVVAAHAPPMALATLAGVALLGVFANSAHAALQDPSAREAAAVTFLTTASGMTLFGLGAAVWGLILGWSIHVVTHRSRA
jgi:benzoate membrane transport protein